MSSEPKEFNLAEFMSGTPATTKSGTELTFVRYDNDREDVYKISAVRDDGALRYFDVFGVKHPDCAGGNLLYMAEKPVEFYDWGIFSEDVCTLEKREGGRWALHQQGDSRVMVILESYMCEGFFPECPVGTVIERPK